MGGQAKSDTVHYYSYRPIRDHWRFMWKTMRQAEDDTDWRVERERVAALRKGVVVRTVARPIRKSWWQIMYELDRAGGQN